MSTGMPEQSGNGEMGQPEPEIREQRAYSPPPPDDINPNPVMTAFRERGYDTSSFSDDQQFVQTLESGLSQLSEMPALRQQIEAAQQPSPPTDYIEPMPSSAPAPDSTETEAWDPPEYDERWENLVQVDPETGRFIPTSEHVNPNVAHRANEYREWLKSQGKEFWQQPYDFMKKGLGDWVRGIVNDHVDAALYQNNVDGNVENFLETNKSQFYVMDQNGNQVMDPQTGGEMLTPQGQALKGHAEQAKELGIFEPDKIQAYALSMLERDLYAGQANQQYYAQQQAAQQKPRTFLEEAGPTSGQANWAPNRDATVHSATEGGMAQNDNLSFFDMALPELVNMGLVQQTG